MNDRFIKIDNFLKYWRDILIENPLYSSTADAVYNKLIHSSSNSEKEYIPSNLMSELILRYSNIRNDGYFLQYYNFDNKERYKDASDDNFVFMEHIKLYVPQDFNHIEKSSKMIFDFLTENNMVHASKISSEIRFDDIVVRLTKVEDAIKFKDFIKNNQYIQEGLIEPNPFTFSEDGIAHACDGIVSYNETVAYWMNQYLLDHKDKGLLSEIGVRDFRKFVLENIDKEYQTETLFCSNSIFKCQSRDELYASSLMLKSLDPDFCIDDYYDHFTESLTKKEVLMYYEVIKKNYNENISFANLSHYIISGDENYLPHEVRGFAVNSSFRENVEKIMKRKDVSFPVLLSQSKMDFGYYGEKFFYVKDNDTEFIRKKTHYDYETVSRDELISSLKEFITENHLSSVDDAVKIGFVKFLNRQQYQELTGDNVRVGVENEMNSMFGGSDTKDHLTSTYCM